MSELFPLEEARHVQDCGLPLWNLSRDEDPELLLAYFEWLTKAGNEDAFESAVNSMQQVGVGFNALHIKRSRSPNTGKMTNSLQLNFYCEAVGGTGEESPHTHSRNAHATWYSTGARQVISRWRPTDHEPPAEYDADFKLVDVVANAIIDNNDGRLPGYYPKKIGEGVLWLLSRTKVAPLGSQTFSNREVHAVSVDWHKESIHRKNAKLGQVAVSAHYKSEEPEAHTEYPEPFNSHPMNTREFLHISHGLTGYQSQEAYDLIEEVKQKYNLNYDAFDPRSQLITIVYPPRISSIEHLEGQPKATNPDVAKDLILGSIETLRALV